MQNHFRSEICVYCSTSVPTDIFSYHLQSCRRSYGGGRLAVCPYNPVHRIPAGNEWSHIRSCPSANVVMKVLNEMNSYAIVSAQLQKQLCGVQRDSVQRDKRGCPELNEREDTPPLGQKKRKYEEGESQDEEM